uniref:Uncharacterized protein n=1 Tax=Octopus bimaculoides TaxID=37653 RepID=A0A0L8GJZ1_OCTBM
MEKILLTCCMSQQVVAVVMMLYKNIIKYYCLWRQEFIQHKCITLQGILLATFLFTIYLD